jgi:putative flippase GtrA
MLWFMKRKLYFSNSLAISAAYFFATALHFTLNNFFTFSDADTGYQRRIGGYLLVAGCNYFITLIIGNIVFRYIADNVLIVNIAGVAVTTIISYLFLYKFIFSYKGRKKGKCR